MANSLGVHRLTKAKFITDVFTNDREDRRSNVWRKRTSRLDYATEIEVNRAADAINRTGFCTAPWRIERRGWGGETGDCPSQGDVMLGLLMNPNNRILMILATRID